MYALRLDEDMVNYCIPSCGIIRVYFRTMSISIVDVGSEDREESESDRDAHLFLVQDCLLYSTKKTPFIVLPLA